MASPLDLLLDEPVTDAALARLAVESVDGYDLFILEAMSRNGVTQIITDDSDFVTVPGIRVFTANFRTIAQANAQGKLITR